MHRIDTHTAQKDKFGQGENGFTNGDPTTGTPSTKLNSDIYDVLQEEVCTVVKCSGIRLDKSQHDQLYQAIRKLSEEEATKAKIALVDSAPLDLNTLKKLSQALGNNPKFAETVTQQLSQKLSKSENGADIPDKTLFLKNLVFIDFIFPVSIVIWSNQNKIYALPGLAGNILAKIKPLGWQNKTALMSLIPVVATVSRSQQIIFLPIITTFQPEQTHLIMAIKILIMGSGHVHQYTAVFRYNDVGDDGGGHGLYGTRNENTTHSGDHVHTTYLGPHNHAVSRITRNTGKGNSINIVNSFIKLMAWYRTL